MRRRGSRTSRCARRASWCCTASPRSSHASRRASGAAPAGPSRHCRMTNAWRWSPPSPTPPAPPPPPREAVADCYQLCVQLADRLAAHGNFRGFVQAEALGIVQRGGQAVALKTTAGEIGPDGSGGAAGRQSRALLLDAGASLPLYPLKGYSLTAPIDAAHKPPVVSVTDFEKKILYARIGDQLRVAAMVDLVGDDARIDPQRIASLQRAVRATFPQAADYDRAASWAGLRPATPSGAPLVGASGVRNLWLNVGHGALGFTFSFGTADIVAELVAGRASPVALDGLQLT